MFLHPIPGKDHLGASMTQELIRKESEMDSDPILFGRKYISMFFVRSKISENIFTLDSLRGTWICYTPDMFVKYIIDIWFRNYYIPYEDITEEDRKNYPNIVSFIKYVPQMNLTHHIIFKDGMIYDYNKQKFIDRISSAEYSINAPIPFTFEECFTDIDVAFNLLRKAFVTDDDMEYFLNIVLSTLVNIPTYDKVSFYPKKQDTIFFISVIMQIFHEEQQKNMDENGSVQLQLSQWEEDIICLKPYAPAIIGLAVTRKLKHFPRVSDLCFFSYKKLLVQNEKRKYVYRNDQKTEEFPFKKRCVHH